jgi:hypothetical protein
MQCGISFKDLDTIQKLNERDHDINIQNDGNGDTPLHAARYDRETFDFLITLKADRTLCNWTNHKPKRPAFWASQPMDADGDF